MKIYNLIIGLFVVVFCNNSFGWKDKETTHTTGVNHIKQAIKKGTKVIIMDPRKNDMTRHSWEHLEFKPGTDVAMLNALIYTIIEEELYDKQYVQSMTSGFEELKLSIKGFTPEKMSEKCE